MRVKMLGIVAAAVAAVALAGVPAAFAQGEGGNVTCEELGFANSSGKVDYNDGSFDGEFPEGLEVSTDGTYVSWSSTFKIGAVIVKGSNDANVYYYNPQACEGSGLSSPLNSSGFPAGLSNLTFCWGEYEECENGGQWCSPGYWRQEQHLDSWEATGYSPDDLFFDVLGYYPPVTRQGVRAGATTNPTLWEVLQAPQYYGGEAFNAVGDLLSEAHPDVDFQYERVEDSCPLN